MAYHREYFCSVCKKPKARDELTVKKVQFLTLGPAGRVKKSRTEGWLCGDCLKKDPIWNRVEYDAPGTLARDEVPNA